MHYAIKLANRSIILFTLCLTMTLQFMFTCFCSMVRKPILVWDPNQIQSNQYKTMCDPHPISSIHYKPTLRTKAKRMCCMILTSLLYYEQTILISILFLIEKSFSSFTNTYKEET